MRKIARYTLTYAEIVEALAQFIYERDDVEVELRAIMEGPVTFDARKTSDPAHPYTVDSVTIEVEVFDR